jgi:hypothetical protein
VKADGNGVKTSWGTVDDHSVYGLSMTTSSTSHRRVMRFTAAETDDTAAVGSAFDDVSSSTTQELAPTNINTKTRAVTSDVSRLKRSVDDVTLATVDEDLESDIACMTPVKDIRERVCAVLFPG